MAAGEKAFLLGKFQDIPNFMWSFTDYSKKRLAGRGISETDFKALFSKYDLIEFHVGDHGKGGDPRILLRSRTTTEKYNFEVCAVFSLRDARVVTIWINHVTNQHDRLVIANYTKKYDIMQNWKGRL